MLEHALVRQFATPTLPVEMGALFQQRRELLAATRYAPLSVRAQSGRVLILTYHDVIARRGAGSVWFDTTAAELEAQITSLLQRGAVPISLTKLHRHLTTGEAVPKNAVVITFDDNYQGFYDNAFPLVQRLKVPVAMFVHTDYVGVTTGTHPKMTWARLRELAASGLVTIGSHSKSHPEDLSKLSLEAQREELRGSKALLEAQLERPVPFISYPNGKADATTWRLAREAGYTMGFMEDWTPAEESPDILGVNRYINTQLERGWRDLQRSAATPAAFVERPILGRAVRLERFDDEGVSVAVVRGGRPRSVLSATRESVGRAVRDAGAAAGVNGAFFTDARLVGTDNTMIGPVLIGGARFQAERNANLLARIAGRPLVMWGKSRIAVTSFQPAAMNDAAPLRALMPDLTDAFLGGAWLVRDGVARTAAELEGIAPSDSNDRRPRAFMGFSTHGEVMVGASLRPVSSAQLARAVAKLGVMEAVLLDSGYSTSLVYGDRVLAVGRAFAETPSRPVPHAIVLEGARQTSSNPEIKSWLSAARKAY
jgi:peptidoglycan/xylan/chitin deacetylase (PgdA/CDA1 family)